MKSSQPFRVRVATLCGLLSVLFPAPGCAKKFIFDGVALVRSNGDIIVVQKADSVQALRASAELNLSDTELALLESLAARRDRAHAGATGQTAVAASGTQAGRCLTGSGNPPTCYAIDPCKGCALVSQGVTSSGKISSAETVDAGETIPFSAPYAYYCECVSW